MTMLTRTVASVGVTGMAKAKALPAQSGAAPMDECQLAASRISKLPIDVWRAEVTSLPEVMRVTVEGYLTPKARAIRAAEAVDASRAMCSRCPHMIPDAINPEAGLAQCRVNGGTHYPDARHVCRDYKAKDA